MEDPQTTHHTSSASIRSNEASEMDVDDEQFPVFITCNSQTKILLCSQADSRERFMDDIKGLSGRTKDVRWLRVRWFQDLGSTEITEDNYYAVMCMLYSNVGAGFLEMDEAE